MRSLIPFCIILTHRHGACLGIIGSEPLAFLKSNFVETSRAYLSQKQSILEKKNNFEFFMEKDKFICARALGKTAENLSQLFQFACFEFGISQIKSFFVGTGPGSFTGLRLGCAFVNGMHFASQSALFSLPTLLSDELFIQLTDVVERSEVENYNSLDQSSGYVTFFDLFFALHQIAQNNFTACDVLIPNYGKEPAPVLNLKRE